MSLSNVISHIQFWTIGSNWYNPNEDLALSSSEQSALLNYVSNLYNSSSLAATALDGLASSGLIRIGGTDSGSGFASPPNTNVPFLLFDMSQLTDFYAFTDDGRLAKQDERIIIAHEIGHWYHGYHDPTGNPANSTYDYRGDTVQFERDVATEIGLDVDGRTSYAGALEVSDARFSSFDTAVSYTFGSTVDIVRVGDLGSSVSDVLDISARTDSARMLAFGLANADTIAGAGGNDYLMAETAMTSFLAALEMIGHSGAPITTS